jgi:hypothetical protein
MKGTVLKCLGELVKEKFGEQRWREILADANLPTDSFFSPLDDIDDKITYGVIGSACKVLKLTKAQAFDAFGEYWMCVYGPKVYPRYYDGITSAREFMLKLDALHVVVTRSMKNAKPPRFDYSWRDKNTLVMRYKSERSLLDLMVSMTKAVGKYFEENIVVRKSGADEIEIVFPAV